MARIEIDVDPGEFRRQFDWLLENASLGTEEQEGILNMMGAIRDELEERGIPVDLVHDASAASYGALHRDSGMLSPGGTAQGFVFKDALAFARKGDEICYVPELAFDDLEAVDGQYRISDVVDSGEAYTYRDFVDICNGSEKVARHVFEAVRLAGA